MNSCMKSYNELASWLETKGIGSYLQSPDQMVISAENPAMPRSNCFWVTFRKGNWYVVTWSPAAYCVPVAQDIREVCESVFRSSEIAIYTVAPELVERFGLRRLTDNEMGEAGLV